MAPRRAVLPLVALLAAAVAGARAQYLPSGRIAPGVKLPIGIDHHFKLLRAYLHPDYADPHMDVWTESAHVCQEEGADLCAEVMVWLVKTLVGPDPKTSKSRYRELPTTKGPWQEYLNSILNVCLKLQKPGDTTTTAAHDKCRKDAADKFIKAGSGNNILKLSTPISVSWTAFFDLPACLLVQVDGKCNGVDCGKLLGWTADRCYDK